MHASQHCTTLRDSKGDLISSRGFESRLSVNSASSRNPTAKLSNTLDTADVIVGLRVSAAAQLGDLLHNLSAALTSSTEFSSETC